MKRYISSSTKQDEYNNYLNSLDKMINDGVTVGKFLYSSKLSGDTNVKFFVQYPSQIDQFGDIKTSYLGLKNVNDLIKDNQFSNLKVLDYEDGKLIAVEE